MKLRVRQFGTVYVHRDFILELPTDIDPNTLLNLVAKIKPTDWPDGEPKYVDEYGREFAVEDVYEADSPKVKPAKYLDFSGYDKIADKLKTPTHELIASARKFTTEYQAGHPGVPWYVVDEENDE